MKIELETINKGNKQSLKIKLGEGANSISNVVEDFSQPIGPVLADLLNNTRLTVKEREHEELELSKLISYLTWNALPEYSEEEVLINESPLDTLISDDEILENINVTKNNDEQ